MSVLLIRILLICAIPLEIYILVKGIKLLRKAFHGKIILELSLDKLSKNFMLTKSGIYSIWWKGQFLQSIPIHVFKPKIIIFPFQQHYATVKTGKKYNYIISIEKQHFLLDMYYYIIL